MILFQFQFIPDDDRYSVETGRNCVSFIYFPVNKSKISFFVTCCINFSLSSFVYIIPYDGSPKLYVDETYQLLANSIDKYKNDEQKTNNHTALAEHYKSGETSNIIKLEFVLNETKYLEYCCRRNLQ